MLVGREGEERGRGDRGGRAEEGGERGRKGGERGERGWGEGRERGRRGGGGEREVQCSATADTVNIVHQTAWDVYKI